MRFPVFSAHVNPAVDLPLLRKKRGYVQNLLDTGTARALDPKNFKAGVQLLAKLKPESQVEYLSIGNLIPFSRIQNPLFKPESINYPIPACADHRQRYMNRMSTMMRDQSAYSSLGCRAIGL